MDDLLLDFVTESKEHLETIEDDFVLLVQTKDDPDPEVVNKVFRAIHTVKGVAGFVGQKRIGELSHIMESLLQQIKVGKKKPEQRYIDVLLEGVDQLNAMLDDVENSNEMDISAVYEKTKLMVDESPEEAAERQPDGDAAGQDAGEAPDDPPPPPPATPDAWPDEPETPPAAPGTDEPETPPAAPGTDEPEPGPESTGQEPPAEPGPESTDQGTEPEEEPGFRIPEIRVTPDMVARFTQESLDLLDEAEQSMLALEAEPQAANALIGEAFRMMHSFKGNCGFFGLADFEKLSHKVESVLDMMRTGELSSSWDAIGMLLKTVDFLRSGLGKYAETGQSKIMGLPGMIDLLESITPSTAPHATEQPAPAAKDKTTGSKAAKKVATGTAPPAPAQSAPPETAKTAAAVAPGKTTSPAPAKPADTPLPPASKTEAPPPARQAAPADDRQDAAAKSGGNAAAIRQGIRVDIAKLDSLINLVGELVIAEAMVVRNPAVMTLDDEMLAKAIHHLNRVSAELQDIAMSVRMIPLSGTFRKMSRLVYDVSKRAGKKVDLHLEGEETEVDKTVIEQIGDPLVHIVRNAIDHGLEAPADRRLAGKPETGNVRIEAKHEGGEVWIVVRDDGRGLNKEKILNKAIANGLLLEGDNTEMKDEDIYKLIFEPGFSTADKVTDISGRGVGMDVVKKNIEKLKGRVEVRSDPGKGSTFILHIPLTLAIIDGMLIRVGRARYTIPLLSIRETLRPVASQITITPDKRETVRVRDEMIPVLRLHQVFNISPDFEALDQGLLMIVESDGNNVALFVDELLGQNQTVIKGLSDYLGQARGVSGCTILGNGEVSLILNINGLIELLDEMN